MILSKNEKLLVIAPHADDEILGCYGLIKKIKDLGGKAYVQILTMGGYDKIGSNIVKKTQWRKEFLSVCKEMSIDDYDIMLYGDPIQHIDDIPRSEVISYLETKSNVSIFKIKPTIVAIPTIFSSHQDHTRAYQVAISALRTQPSTDFVAPKMVISYESPEYHFWSPYIEFGKFSPNLYIKLNKSEIKKKVAILKKYDTQIKIGKRDSEKVHSLGSIRGSEVGAEFAESFHIHRYIY